jgi:hypothetical protein
MTMPVLAFVSRLSDVMVRSGQQPGKTGGYGGGGYGYAGGGGFQNFW